MCEWESESNSLYSKSRYYKLHNWRIPCIRNSRIMQTKKRTFKNRVFSCMLSSYSKVDWCVSEKASQMHCSIVPLFQNLASKWIIQKFHSPPKRELSLGSPEYFPLWESDILVDWKIRFINVVMLQTTFWKVTYIFFIKKGKGGWKFANNHIMGWDGIWII